MPGVAVNVFISERAASGATDRPLNAASISGSVTVSDVEGVVRCKVLPGITYGVGATCTGYQAYGSLGERTTVCASEGEKVRRVRFTLWVVGWVTGWVGGMCIGCVRAWLGACCPGRQCW